jgi:hypothetical protein
MPVTQANMRCVLSWSSSVANASGFGPRTQGPDSIDFTLNGLNLNTFNQIHSGDVTVGASGHTDIDVTNLVNLNDEPVSFGHLEAIMLVANGGNLVITPTSANPLLGIFGGASDASIPLTGLFTWTNGTGTDTLGYATSGTSKTFRLNNVGSGAATVSIGILGGP